ncbi:MAG: DUF4037 domain-containing protein [Spirochaetaceae bacterium]|jgi:hypothetical protein|nr:DUF4037 domain-containing protein [Spirochaetaceae bacterium]
MKHKTKILADRFTEALSARPEVECVSLNEAALEDPLDPYFALIFDVFYTGDIPGPEVRRIWYGPGITALETSKQARKDRFLAGELPVRLEYKAVREIDEIVSFADAKRESLWLIKDLGTYGYYRLTEGALLFSRTQWIKEIRRRLLGLGDRFWNELRLAHQSSMEHLLGDLGAAFLQNDDFHYLISSALFIKTACLTLFCVNRRFEPSHRAYYNQVVRLPVLPESFPVHLESFLKFAPEMTRERQYSLAQLMARGVVAL